MCVCLCKHPEAGLGLVPHCPFFLYLSSLLSRIGTPRLGHCLPVTMGRGRMAVQLLADEALVSSVVPWSFLWVAQAGGQRVK